MTKDDRGHYADKHPSDRKADPKIADEIKRRAADQQISCAAAMQVARALGAPPSEVGFVIDTLEVRIIKCQLGLFGYQPEKKVVKAADHVSEALKTEINSNLSNGRLPCQSAWGIAKQRKKSKMFVSSACETLKIKISPCQLGAF